MFLVAAVALLLGAPAWAAAPSYRVLEVVDGDTLKLEGAEGRVRLRIVGIDTPETRHPESTEQYLGAEARERLRELIGGRPVTLAGAKKKDRYGRRLARVLNAAGEDVGARLLEEGLARVLRKYDFDEKGRYIALEAAARQAGRGLWREGGRAELRWLLARDETPIEVLPMSGGRFAVLAFGWAKTGVRTRDVDDALWAARKALGARRRDPERAVAILEAAGFSRVPSAQ